MPGCVLDSFALVAYFRDEAGADKIENLLHKAATGHEPLHMTEVNYAEVQYIIIRRNGLSGWETAAASLVSLPIAFHPVTRELADIAARLKLLIESVWPMLLPLRWPNTEIANSSPAILNSKQSKAS